MTERRGVGKILPEEIRTDLLNGFKDLHLGNRQFAKQAEVSPSFISNLLLGTKNVKSLAHISRVAAALEEYTKNSHIEEQERKRIEAAVTNMRKFYGIIPGFDMADLRGVMGDSIRIVIEQQAQLTQALANHVQVNSQVILQEEFTVGLRLNGTFNQMILMLLQDYRGFISDSDKLK